MDNQLSNISTQYRKFSKGQYIEYTQFNEFLDFFEDQDRLSRVMLQGTGVVCGFKPKLIYTNRVLSSIQLSQGTAITTDGDLLTLSNTSEVSKELYISDLKTINIESKDYTHFKVYDNFKVNYPAFYDKDSRQVDLWELSTAQNAGSDFQPVSNLSNVEDKYLLLYLEDYEKDVKPCRGVDCDNHGVQQIRNLKVLVTTAKGISNMIGEDLIFIPGVTQPVRKDLMQRHPLFIDDILKPAMQERVIVERLILNNNTETHFSSSSLKDLYVKALDKYGYGESLFKKIEAISRIMGTPTAYYPAFKNTIDQFLAQQSGFQYAYDVVKDLADTYSEIIKLLPKAFTKDLPDLPSFPKHIMLGKLIPGKQLDFSRHQFYNSPVLDDDKATQRVKILINRFNQQVQNFKYSDVYNDGKTKVKITPSQKLNSLGNKAIPFYYYITEDFLKAWNFDKTSNRSFKDNLTYDTSWLSSGPSAQEDPLNLNMDNNSFFNIEGHQGMDYQKAFEQIKQIRDKQQLAFDIMLVSLDELIDNKDLVKAYFNDYVEKHPGLEHKRGVERKGTFVIVYENIRNVTKVVADFSLPYICCTPKTEVKLSLPTTVICSESKQIPFTVFPVNGDVKAVVGTDLDGGVRNINGTYFFDPTLVSKSLYGQNISFTVNGKPTNCSIKVTPQPNVKIVVSSVTYPSDVSSPTVVKFKISENNFMDYDYSWDFWDDGGSIPLNPDLEADGTGTVSYNFYNLDPLRMPTVKVKVIGNGCTETIAVNLPVTKECPVVSNIKYKVVDNRDNTQTFTFDWDLPSDLSGITGLNIYTSNDIANGWHYESGSYSPQRSITLPLGKYYIRFSLVGSCREAGSTLNLPGLNDVGIVKDQNNHPPTVSIKWQDTSGTEDRLCTQSACSYTVDVTAYDQDGDITNIEIYKSTNNGTTWSALTSSPSLNKFIDSINVVGTNLYKAVVVDGKNNTATSNILSYKKEYRPTVVIENIGFPSNGNCCNAVLSPIIASAGGDKDITLSNLLIRELGLKGSGRGPTTNLLYFWSKLAGPDVILENVNGPTLVIKDLRVGKYKFQLLVKDADSDAFEIDVAEVKVN